MVNFVLILNIYFIFILLTIYAKKRANKFECSFIKSCEYYVLNVFYYNDYD